MRVRNILTVGCVLMFSFHWIIRLIGLLAIIEAGVLFLISKKLYDELINWYVNLASDNIYRLFGIISLVFGTVFLSWIF